MAFSTKQLTSSFLWDFLGKFLKKGLTFIIGIILARILTPEEFGLVGLATVFISISGSLIGVGLIPALIQRKNPTEEHFSSVFWLTIGISLLLAVLIFSVAPLIASYYDMEELKGILRLLSINTFIQGLTVTQNAYLKKHLKFKATNLSQLVSNLSGGLVGLTMALNGFGVWSLVAKSIVSSTINSSMLWFQSSWKPAFIYRQQSINELRQYGANMYMSSILNMLFTKLDSIVIGKLFSAAQLGFYSRALSMNRFIIEFSSQSIGAVTMPYLSAIQDDTKSLVDKNLKITNIVAFNTFGLVGLLYILSEPLIILTVGEKWRPSIALFELLCLSAYAYPIGSATLSLLQASGNSKMFLRLEIIKKILLVAAFVVGFQFGIEGYLVAFALVVFIGTLLNMYYSGKGLDLTLGKQLDNIQGYFWITIALICLMKVLPVNSIGYIIQLPVYILSFSFIYLISNLVFKTFASKLILKLLKRKL